MANFHTLDDVDVKGKSVLVRADLNVPMRDGRVSDMLRIERQAPTMRELSDKGAKVIVLSHFDRPKGKVVPEMSLKPVSYALAFALTRDVHFAKDCVGPVAEKAVAEMQDGDVLLLENTRFHAGEEKNGPEFAKALAKLGDIYVNDAFSAAHRAHASTAAIARLLPSVAGRAMEEELRHLEKALSDPERPLMAVVGGAKVSSKIALLENMVGQVETLVIGGAMANTFLAAEGLGVGRSLYEPEYLKTARKVLHMATESGCAILLPSDVVVAKEFKPGAPHRTVPVTEIGADEMALDVGPKTVAAAKAVAKATKAGKLLSVAGGGDTVAALAHAGVEHDFSYVSTAGGAFLEWLEGKDLPGVTALMTK